jgi:exonuclease SbcC
VAAGLGALETQLGEIGEVDVAGTVSALEGVRSAHAQAQTAAAAAQAELEQRTVALTSWKERVERAAEADPSEPCPTCGRPLGEDFSAYRKHCRAEAAAAKKAETAATKAVAASRREVSAAAASLEEAATAAEDARRSHERRTELTERAEAMRSEVGELAAPFGGEVPDADELRARSERARAVAERIAALEAQHGHLDRLREDLASSEERVRALQGDVEALTEEAGTVAFDAQEHAARSAELDRARDALEAAERTLGETADAAREAELRHRELAGAVRQATETAARVQELRSDARYVGRVALLLDGFRDHLVARVGPELSREAEALFRELTNREYDDLKVDEESLAIQIADGETYFPLDRFSGSETDLANLALRVAISTHLSRVSGADVGLLVLDEVLGSLDEERKDLMVRTLGSLSSRFHQVFVITHAERVKDQFPASILVRKVGRRRSEAVLV